MNQIIPVRVAFRTEKSGDFKGEVTAVFSGSGRHTAYELDCYAHNGQHGTCTQAWLTDHTRAATEEEYADLLRELEAIGYRVTVVKRVTWKQER